MTPRGTQPRAQPHERSGRLYTPPSRPRGDLLSEIRGRLRGEPLDLLGFVSTLVCALDPRTPTPFARRQRDQDAGPVGELGELVELVESFAGVDRIETTALLAAISVLAPDELLRARTRRAAATRTHPLPPWLAHLDAARAGRAMEMTHVLGDGDDLIVELDLPGAPRGGTLSVVVYVDHNLGSVAKDGFVVPEPMDELVAYMKTHTEAPADTTWQEVDRADARAMITGAVDGGAMVVPRLESDTWPECRPIVEWVARLLPGGGNGYGRPEWDDAAKKALTEAFFGSPMAAGLRDRRSRELFESILWFATDYGPGDPLRWSPVSVEILLADWIPRKILAPAALLSEAPDVLRAFIRYAHARRGIRAGLTAETLAAVDQLEPEYQHAIRTPRPQGPLALLAAVGALGPQGLRGRSGGPDEWGGEWGEDAFADEDDVEDLEDDLEDDLFHDPARFLRETLSRAVGGDDALATLDDLALPDEPFAWDGIADDIAPKVAEVLAVCDRCCDELLDVEYRTACRRFLARAARGGPHVFRRRGRADTAAAAVCWTVGKANELFSPSGGGMYAKDLLAHFGLAQGSVSQRAATLMKAAGIEGRYGYYPAWDVALGDPGLLVSGRRRRIMERRDRSLHE